MENIISHYLTTFNLPLLLLVIAITLFTLSKGADLLVNEAVLLSKQLRVPEMLIGATIISLGTTLPEASVSVYAALSGNPDLALGNAVGSIICDTGLILGIVTLLARPTFKKNIMNRHAWIQFLAGILLVLVALPFSSLNTVFTSGGNISQASGILFIILLFLYLFISIKWSKNKQNEPEVIIDTRGKKSTILVLLNIAFGIFIIIASSKILIPTVEEAALRLYVPKSIIAATLVAFGTSLPEMVTAIAAVRKGQGDLAIGNIIGADILNVLFVVGASASVTPGGLAVPANFFTSLFPTMLFVLFIFRFGPMLTKYQLNRTLGLILLGSYFFINFLSYSNSLV